MPFRSPKKNKSMFNTNAFIQFILLFCFLCFLIELDITNQLSLYINPKFTILIEISCCFLVPIIFVRLFDTILPFDKPHEHSHVGYFQYIPFFVILLLAVTTPSKTLNANLVGNKGLNSALTGNAFTPTVQAALRPLANELQQTTFIKITDRNYTEAISELTDFPNDYLGKKVSLTGFVFRSPGLTNQQFSLVRYVMTCCVADSLPYGIMCEFKNAKKYPDGTWLTIEGILQIGKYKDLDTPYINISSVNQISVPENPYIFPYVQ